MKCSRCSADARPNQRLCLHCHAEAQKGYRADSRDRLVRIESMLEILLDERKPARKAFARTAAEIRRRA